MYFLSWVRLSRGYQSLAGITLQRVKSLKVQSPPPSLHCLDIILEESFGSYRNVPESSTHKEKFSSILTLVKHKIIQKLDLKGYLLGSKMKTN